jgi:tetratricopeptide (TPR) repeat protein
MMKRTMCLAAALMTWAGAAQAAEATPQQLQRRCDNYALPADHQAAACTAIIRVYSNTPAFRALVALGLLARGTALTRMGERMRAEADFREAIRLASIPIDGGDRDVTVLNDRCWARAVAMLELDAALADCNEALRQRPDFVPALDTRGFIHLRSGRFREAIADYDAALKIDPRDSYSLYGRAIAKLRLGDSTGVQADIEASKDVVDVVAEFAAYGLAP